MTIYMSGGEMTIEYRYRVLEITLEGGTNPVWMDTWANEQEILEKYPWLEPFSPFGPDFKLQLKNSHRVDGEWKGTSIEIRRAK